jgi:hypothetical protein
MRVLLCNTFQAGCAKLSAIVLLSEQIVGLSVRIGLTIRKTESVQRRRECELVESVTWNRPGDINRRHGPWSDTCICSRKPRPGEAMGEALLAVLPGKGRIGSLATPSSDSRLFSVCSMGIWTRYLWMRHSEPIRIRQGTCAPGTYYLSPLRVRF